MGRAHPDLATTPDVAGLDIAWRRPRTHGDDRLPLGACALVIGGLSVGMWALACLGLHVLG